eukprot:g53486.t1
MSNPNGAFLLRGLSLLAAYSLAPIAASRYNYYVPHGEKPQIEEYTEIVNYGDPNAEVGHDIGADLSSVMHITVIYPNTRICYDHWEDGYESDIDNCAQKSTEIWGDMNEYNGKPPKYTTDERLKPPMHIVYKQDFYNLTASDRDPAKYMYDAKDRIYASHPMGIIKMGYPTQVGLGYADMIDISTGKQNAGKDFMIPLGGDNYGEPETRNACTGECRYVRLPYDILPYDHGFNVRHRDCCGWDYSPLGSYSYAKAHVLIYYQGTTVCQHRAGKLRKCQTGGQGETLYFPVLANDKLESNMEITVSLLLGRPNSDIELRRYEVPPVDGLDTEWFTSFHHEVASASIYPTTVLPYAVASYIVVYNPNKHQSITADYRQGAYVYSFEVAPYSNVIVKQPQDAPWALNPSETARYYSSIWENHPKGTGQCQSQIDSETAWCAGAYDANQFMTIALGRSVHVSGLVTRGHAIKYQWVTKYKVKVSNDGVTYNDVDNGYVFTANTDRSSKVAISFAMPVPAKYVQIAPVEWHDGICIRAAVLEKMPSGDGGKKYVSHITCSQNCMAMLHVDLPNGGWGHTMIPQKHLQSTVVATTGWTALPALTCFDDPYKTCQYPQHFSMPLWIATTDAAKIYIDDDGDCMSDYDRYMLAGESFVYYSPRRRDLSGAKIYTSDSIAKVVAIWGPKYVAGQEAGLMHMGAALYGLQPQSIQLEERKYGATCLPAGGGGIAVFSLTAISNTWGYPTPGGSFHFQYTLQSGYSYVPESCKYTVIDVQGYNTTYDIPDDHHATTFFPLDKGGYANWEMAPGAQHVVTWSATWDCRQPSAVDDIVYGYAKSEEATDCPAVNGNLLLNDNAGHSDQVIYVRLAKGVDGMIDVDSSYTAYRGKAIGDKGVFSVKRNGDWTFTPDGPSCNCESWFYYTICLEKVYDQDLCRTAQVRIVSAYPKLLPKPDYVYFTLGNESMQRSVLYNDHAVPYPYLYVKSYRSPNGEAVASRKKEDGSTPYPVQGSNGGRFYMWYDGSFTFEGKDMPKTTYNSAVENRTLPTYLEYQVCCNLPGYNAAALFVICKWEQLAVEVAYVEAVNDLAYCNWPRGTVGGDVCMNDKSTYSIIVSRIVGKDGKPTPMPKDHGTSPVVYGSHGGEFVFDKDGKYLFRPHGMDKAKFNYAGGTVETSIDYEVCGPDIYKPCAWARLTILVTMSGPIDPQTVPYCPEKPKATDVCFCPYLDENLSGLNLAATRPELALMVRLDVYYYRFYNQTLHSPRFSFPGHCWKNLPEVSWTVAEQAEYTQQPCSYNFKVTIDYLNSCNFYVTTSEDKYVFSGYLQVDGEMYNLFLGSLLVQNYHRPLGFKIVLPRTLEVEAEVIVKQADQCHSDADCNYQTCAPLEPYGPKVCQCDICHSGPYCRTDTCPPELLCPYDAVIDVCYIYDGAFYDVYDNVVYIPAVHVLATDIYFASGSYQGIKRVGSGKWDLPFGLSIAGYETAIVGKVDDYYPAEPYPVQLASGPYLLPRYLFPGPFYVKYLATDQAHNTGYCRYQVSLRDVCSPLITCAAIYYSNNSQDLNAKFDPSYPLMIKVKDLQDDITITRYPSAPFGPDTPDGVYYLTFCASDGYNPPSCCNQTVVLDRTSPYIVTYDLDLPTADYENYSLPTSLYNPLCTDAGGGIDKTFGGGKGYMEMPLIERKNVQWPNTRGVPVKKTCFTCRDYAGNEASGCVYVKVDDKLPPKIDCVLKVLENDRMFDPMSLFYTRDNDQVLDYTKLSPAKFPIGTSYFTMKAMDVSLNSASKSCPLIVKDIEPPYVPAYLEREVIKYMDYGSDCYQARYFLFELIETEVYDNNELGAIYITVNGYTVTLERARELDDEQFLRLCGEHTTRISVEACDVPVASYPPNCATFAFDITVVDYEPPVPTCPYGNYDGVLSVEADIGAHCVVPEYFEPVVVTDNYGYAGRYEISPSPTYCFPLGETTVMYTVYDIAKVPNMAYCTFVVRVAEIRYPYYNITLDVPDFYVDAGWDTNTYNIILPIAISCYDEKYGNCSFYWYGPLENPYKVKYYEDEDPPSYNYTVCHTNKADWTKCKNGKITIISNQSPRLKVPADKVWDLNCTVSEYEHTFYWVESDFDTFDNDAETAMYPMELVVPQSPFTLSCLTYGDLKHTVSATLYEREHFPYMPRRSVTEYFSLSLVDSCPPVLGCSKIPNLEVSCPYGKCEQDDDWNKVDVPLDSDTLTALVVHVTASDNCDPSGHALHVQLDKPPKHLTIGSHAITAVATDASGNVGYVDCPVQVSDKIPPRIHKLPRSQVFYTDDFDPKKDITYSIQEDLEWYDNWGIFDIRVTLDGKVFNYGDTLILVPGKKHVFCTIAEDTYHNLGEEVCWTVSLVDNTAPTAYCPQDLQLEASGAKPAVVYRLVMPVSDNDSPAPSLYWKLTGYEIAEEGYVRADGLVDVYVHFLAYYARLPQSVYLTLTVTDKAGNVFSCQWKVTVVDTTPPVIDCSYAKNIPIRSTTPGEYKVRLPYYPSLEDLGVSVNDLHDPYPIITFDSAPLTEFTYYEAGHNRYPVTITATDNMTDPVSSSKVSLCFYIEVLPPCPVADVQAAVKSIYFYYREQKNYVNIEFLTGVKFPYTIYAGLLKDAVIADDKTYSTLIGFKSMEVGYGAYGSSPSVCTYKPGYADKDYCIQSWNTTIELGSCEATTLAIYLPFYAVGDLADDPICAAATTTTKVNINLKCAGFCERVLRNVQVEAQLTTYAHDETWGKFVAYPPMVSVDENGKIDGPPVSSMEVDALLGPSKKSFQNGDWVVGLVSVTSPEMLVKSVTLIRVERAVCRDPYFKDCLYSENLVDRGKGGGKVEVTPGTTEGFLSNSFAWFSYYESLYEPSSDVSFKQYVRLTATVEVMYHLSNYQMGRRRLQVELESQEISPALSNLLPRRLLTQKDDNSLTTAEGKIEMSIANNPKNLDVPAVSTGGAYSNAKLRTQLITAFSVAVSLAVVLGVFYWGWKHVRHAKPSQEVRRSTVSGVEGQPNSTPGSSATGSMNADATTQAHPGSTSQSDTLIAPAPVASEFLSANGKVKQLEELDHTVGASARLHASSGSRPLPSSARAMAPASPRA